MGGLSPWHLAILLAVLILLFGAKKLPDAARGLGRSLKILKAETKGLREDDEESSHASDATNATNPDSKQLPNGSSAATASTTEDQRVADLQRQLDELKQPDQTHKNAS